MKKQAQAAKKAWVTIRKNLGFSHNVLVPNVKGLYDYSQSERKETKVRPEVVNACRNLPKGNEPILSLTSNQCLQELAIIGAGIKAIFHSVEADLNTFHLLLLNAKKYGWMFDETKKRSKGFLSTITFGKAASIIYTATANSFRTMLLDYCGSIKTFGPEIAHAISNDLVKKGGFIYITLCQRAAGMDTQKQVYDLVRKAGGGRYRIEFEAGYRDSAPMYSAVIRRVK